MPSQDLESVGQRAHPLAVPARKSRDVTKDTGFGLRISTGLNSFAQCGSNGDFVEDRRGANHGEARAKLGFFKSSAGCSSFLLFTRVCPSCLVGCFLFRV